MYPAKKTYFNMGKMMAMKSLRAKYMELGRAFDAMGQPVINDLDMLEGIYELYLDIFRRRGKEELTRQVYHRKKFLLVVMYLYSPKTLVGGKMRVGLRDRLSQIFGLTSRTAVSDNCSSLMLTYSRYPDFRRDVGLLLREVSEKLGLESALLE